MHACMHACVHTYIHKYIHMCLHAWISLLYFTLHCIPFHYIALHTDMCVCASCGAAAVQCMRQCQRPLRLGAGNAPVAGWCLHSWPRWVALPCQQPGCTRAINHPTPCPHSVERPAPSTPALAQNPGTSLTTSPAFCRP